MKLNRLFTTLVLMGFLFIPTMAGETQTRIDRLGRYSGGPVSHAMIRDMQIIMTRTNIQEAAGGPLDDIPFCWGTNDDACIEYDEDGTNTALMTGAWTLATTGTLNIVDDGAGLLFGGVVLTSTVAELNILDGVTATFTELNLIDGVTATTAELNVVADISARQVACGASKTLSASDPYVVLLDNATSQLTLPAATAAGNLRFKVIVTTTSSAAAILLTGDDTLNGVVYQIDTDTGDALVAYPALVGDGFDKLNFNGTTTGGIIGSVYIFEETAVDVWTVTGHELAAGTVAISMSTT